MSLTPITQYASTTSINPRVTSNARTNQSLTASVRTLASGEVLHSNGLSAASNPDAKSSINVAYDHLSRQTDIGPDANSNASHQTFLASYEQNSGAGASSQSSGTLFRTSA